MKKKRISIIVVVALLIFSTIGGIFAVTANETTVGNNILYMFMPKSDVAEWGDDKVTVYVRKNKDYDAQKDKSKPMNSVEFYYYDKQGNEVVVVGADSVEYEGVDYGVPYFAFVIKAAENLSHFKKIMGIVCVIVAIIAVVIGIVLWYIAFSKNEDLEKAKKYNNNNSKKRRK